MSTPPRIDSRTDPCRQRDTPSQRRARRERAVALWAKRRIARQVLLQMKLNALNKAGMAARMGTSRAALNRLLDTTDTSLTLATLASAAAVLGKTLRIELV